MLLADTTKGWKWQFFHMLFRSPLPSCAIKLKIQLLLFLPRSTHSFSQLHSLERAYLLDKKRTDSLGHPWKLVSTCPRNQPFVKLLAFIDCERKETKILEAKEVKSWCFFPSLMSVYCKMFWIMPAVTFLKKPGKTLWWFTLLVCRHANSGLWRPHVLELPCLPHPSVAKFVTTSDESSHLKPVWHRDLGAQRFQLTSLTDSLF